MSSSNVAARLVSLQTAVLEMIAYGEPISLISERICREAEALSEGTVCSILCVDADRHLKTLAAPSLPVHVSRAFSGLAIGPSVGSCGTSAFLGEPVTVVDITDDERWLHYKDLVLPLGLMACWSSPIKSRDARILGTFAFYYRAKRGPTAVENAIVASLTNLCAIMLEHREIQLKVHELAFTDTLSQLPNRASYNNRVDELVKDPDANFALLLLDIDHLKAANDMMGHSVGDALIRTVAARLRDMGGSLEPFRLGGDEFGLIVHGCDTPEAMEEVARSLIAKAELPFEADGYTVVPSVTIGGAIYAGEGEAERLVQNADMALYHGKENSRGSFVAYRETLQTSMARRVAVIGALGSALNENRVEAFYQPIVRIDTGAIVGLEALARIQMPNGLVQTAAQFHEATSDPRLAYELTGRMLGQVASAVRSWLDLGLPFQHIGINVTQADFKKGDLEQRIVDAFAAAEVPLKHIILEVNEAVYLGPGDDFVANAVERLRSRGILVALDDFGTGFASLTHLLHFPVDILKIDRSFVTNLKDDRNSEVIVEALLSIASKLNMKIVAEGIETLEQAERLVSMGCVLGQGYRFAPPVPRNMTTELLKRFSQGLGHTRFTPGLPLIDQLDLNDTR